MNILLPKKHLMLMLVGLLSQRSNVAFAALSQADEGQYLASFDSMEAATYAVADRDLPLELNVCKNDKGPPTREVTAQASNGVINSSMVSEQCGTDSLCIIPIGTTLQMDTSLNLGALIVRGIVEWNDSTQVYQSSFLCSGYVAVEGAGQWDMDLQTKDAFIYIKDNGAVHPHLRSRAFGSYAATSTDYPVIDINGRELVRTWSLLSAPIQVGDSKINLMHNANLMGWRVGDRIGIAPTEHRATGYGEEFTITGITEKGSLLLNRAAQHNHAASFVPPPPHGNAPALMSAEVVNLSRNIVITGDEFKHVGCDSNLPEAVPGEETSVLGCRCSSFRNQCTLGLHTAIMHGGSASIQNTRIERCGQRGIEGKYCLHFHKLHDCPTCLFKNNAIEGSHQRGIIVHSTHGSTVEENVLYNVRGAGIYIEDGNEMYNKIKYNVVICPFPFSHVALHGCTVPGTSGRIADTSDNQSGIFTRAATNSLTGNRVSNSFNGMLLKAGSIGRGESYDKVCESAAKLARYEGNTFHGNGRFGTYTLGFNYAKQTDQSILTNGHNLDKSLCSGFDSQGYDKGLSASIVDNVDYHNSFVGHYEAGEMQYNGHHSYGSTNLLYWKETKPFHNGCSAHLTGSSYAEGNVALPDQGTFLIEKTVFGKGVSLEANHHCNVGSTGVLCFPTYMLHNVQWKNADTSMKWIWFQWQERQSHNSNQNHGGVFTLSPPDAQQVMSGGVLEHSIFPPGFVSLVSAKFTYLLSLPGSPCILSTAQYGQLYDGGILCKVPLRALKVYSRDQAPGAPGIRVEIWYNKGGLGNQEVGSPDSTQIIGFHQTGSSGPKQGYSIPVIPSTNHSYRLSLASGNGDIPSSWVVEFGDLVVGNRFGVEYINLSINGRGCGVGGLVSSHHDRRFMWSGDSLMADEAWGNTGACAIASPSDFPTEDCSPINDGVLQADECPELCSNACGPAEYCDCSSATCDFKPGFTEGFDFCAAARCGEHGTCAAQYLGGSELPVTSNACICDEGWSGPLCQYNPCETTGKTCSGHGTCIATSDTDAACQCEDGYSGDNCEETCNGFCVGEFPFSCARSIPGIERYGCSQSGGCNYLGAGDEYPFGGFCTYKQEQTQECLCGSDNDCELAVSCSPDGSCPSPQYLPDNTACNSVPFGTCQGGTCTSDGTSVRPSRQPTPPPTQTFVTPTSRPTLAPTKTLTASPTPSQGASNCGCPACTDTIWNTPVTDGAGTFTCGERITYLQSEEGGSNSEYDACAQVGQDFPLDQCGPACNPSLCNAILDEPDPSKLIWSDEFDVDGAPDPTNWDYDLGDGCNIGLCNWGNGEVAYYTDSPSNVVVSNGVLSIKAKKESGFSLPYTSGRMVTRGLHTFKYGRIQFRASLSECKAVGTWPALWMLPEDNVYGGWPNSGEIDVMEAVGHEADRFFGTVHTTSYNGMIGTQKGNSIRRSKDEWHTFEINWTEDSIQFAIDGQIYFEHASSTSVEEWPFDQEFHLIMNTAVGGAWGGQQGIDEAAFEGEGQVMKVDWVRVYADADQPQPTNQPTKKPSNPVTYCGCDSCSEEVWDAVATDSSGSYTCGGRISWLQSDQGYSESQACARVGSEFPDLCLCDPNSCAAPVPTSNPTNSPSKKPTLTPSVRPSSKPTERPTSSPTASPTDSPSKKPTFSPTDSPSKKPTMSPSVSPSKETTASPTESPTSRPTRVPRMAPSEPPTLTYCGCDSCTQQVWNTLATDTSGSYTCGGRISWLQSDQGYSKDDACATVASEFPDVCLCNTVSCMAPPAPAPTSKPTNPPSRKPTAPPVVTYCGCESCTQDVWDTMATDADGNYSCGGRISWLQSDGGFSEYGACEKVSNEFPDNLCGPFCDPTKCSNIIFR